eukprot:2722006-Rhodomonas_salina.5
MGGTTSTERGWTNWGGGLREEVADRMEDICCLTEATNWCRLSTSSVVIPNFAGLAVTLPHQDTEFGQIRNSKTVVVCAGFAFCHRDTQSRMQRAAVAIDVCSGKFRLLFGLLLHLSIDSSSISRSQ